MAVGDHLFDEKEPPPLLRKAINYERWGVGDPMLLPAGLLPRVNVLLNYYHAIKSYQSAHKSTSWAKNNPDAWNMVSWVIAARMERNKYGNRHQ